MHVTFVGNGHVGSRLASLFARASHDVTVAARDGAMPGATGHRVAPVETAFASAEVVVLAIPFAAVHTALPPLAPRLAGKIVVDVTNRVREDWSPLLLGEETSGAQTIARLVPGARVVKAFNTIFADVMVPERLDRGGKRVTAFVAADDESAAEAVSRLARDAGFAPLVVGPLSCARFLESMAHLNIAVAVGRRGGTNAAFLYDQVSG